MYQLILAYKYCGHLNCYFGFFFRFAKSTESKIRWAVNLFDEWKAQRNECAVREPGARLSTIRTPL